MAGSEHLSCDVVGCYVTPSFVIFLFLYYFSILTLYSVESGVQP